ncbi:hypothetical protein EGW08_001781 [Elysia chlorotica]|uniref:Uncharacterized protein n=1 Tax=Elysia chlorotica TaxID=188477 RepID=A0A433U9G0_ELYCH|nr:hypothetical protein EGW08_001781 [Elysia chlorotica]
MLQLPKKCSVGNSTFNEISSVEAVLSQKTLREQGCIKAIQESNNVMLKETRRRHPSNNPDHVSNTEFERTEKPTCEVGSAGIVGLVNKHDSPCTAQELESGVAAKALGECAPSSARDSTGAVALRSGANSEQFKTNSVSSRSPDSKPRELLSKSSEKHTFAVVAKNSMGSRQDMESAKVLTELENESQIDNKEELTTGGCLFDAVARTSGGEVANGFAFLGPDISNQESNSIASMFSVPFRNLKSVGGNSVSNINSTNSTWPFEASNSNHNSGINSVWSTNSKSQTMPFSQSNDSNSKKLSKVDGNIHLKKYVTDDQNNSSAVKDKRAFPISSFGEKQDEKIGTLEVSSEKNVEPETENEENSGDSASSSSSKNSRDSDDSTSASSSSRPSSGIPDCIVADKDGSNESASSQSSASQGGSRSLDCEDSSKTKSDDNLGKSSSNVSLDGSSSEDLHTPHKARPADVSEMEIVCTSNLIMLGDEDTTCTTFASPSKPALLPSEFYPPGVRGKIYEGGSHSRHIRGGSEVLFKPIRLVCQEGDDDDHTECKTICEENEDPTVISDDSSSRDSDVVLQKVEGPQSKSPETSSAPTKPILVFTDNSHDCQIVSTKTESMVSPFNFLKKEDIHNKNLTTKCAQKIHEDNTMMLRKIQGTSTSDTCHKNSEKKNEIKLTSPPMTDETDEVQRRASFDAWKETVHRTYLSVFQQELKTFKEKLMEEVMSKAHQAAQEERRKDLEKLQSAVQQFIRSNVSKSPCRGVEVTAPLETLPEEAISVSLASEQVASAQTHACGSNSAISCQSVPGVNGTKTPISESPASQQVCHSLCSMPPINKSVKKNRNSNNSSDLRGIKKEDHLESTTGRKRASGTYRIRRCSSNTDSPSTHSGDRQFDNCSKTSCHNQTKILKTQVLMNDAHCVWRASPDSCVVTSSDSDKKASTSASKACLDDTREMATFDTDLLGEPDSTSDCCCREVLKRNPPSTKNKLGSGNGKLDVIVPVSNKSESKAQAKIKGNSHRALSVSGKSLESVESQVNVSKSDRMSTTHKALLDGEVNTQEHNKPKSAKVKQPQQPDKPVPKRVQHSDTANVIQQHVELFSDKRDVAQQPDRSMTKRTDIIQQPYTSRDDGTNIVQQPDKAMINSNNMTEIVKQPDKLIDNGTMVNVVQQYDNSMTNRTSILQQPGKSIDDRAMTTAKKITKEEKMSNKMIPEETSKAHQPLPTIIDISQQPDKLILSNKPFSVKNSTPKRPNIVTSPKHVSDEPSMSPVSNKSIHAMESAVTPIKNSSFFLNASPIIDECSQFPSPDNKIPHILNSVSAESTLNLTFTTHKFSDGHMEDSDMETTLVNINHRNEQGETVKLPFDEVSLCSNSLSEFDRDMAQSTPRSERVAKEQMPRFSPMQHLNSSKSATRSFSQVSETQITSGVGKKSRKAERSRNDLQEEKVSLTQALNNTSEPKGNAHSSKSVAGSLPNKNDTRSNGEKEKADLTKHSSAVSSQSLKQNSSTKESSVEDYEETPDGFHSDSDNVLSKHLTYQELHKMGLVKSFFCEDVPYSSPINVLESTIEESEESFVTCPQLSSEEVMFIENVQKVRKNLSRELESNKGTVQSCSEKMPDQAPATYVFSPASSMDRTLSSDLHMSESESDGFPTPIKKGTVPGAVDRSQEQRPQAHGSTASQEKSHLTRGSDLNSQIQVTSKHFDDPELMEEVDKTLVEDDIVFLPPLEELAPKDETLEDGEIDDDDDNNDGGRKETYAVKSNANNVASSSSSKTYRSNFDNSELKKSEHIGKAHAVRNRNIIGRVGGRVSAGIGKSESLVSPLERVYCKQNTSGDGYNTGKVNPALHVNRKNSSTDSIKRQSLISEKDRRSGGRGRSGKRSEKMVCGNKAYATETRRISTTGTRNEHCQDRSGSRISHNQEDAPNTQNSPGLDNQNQRDSRGRIKARPRNSYTDGSVCRSSNGVERSRSRNYGRERPQSRNATRETERPRSRNASRETERPRSRNLSEEAERLHLKNAARETERPQPRNLSRERPNSRNSDRKRHSSKNSQRERPSSRNSCSSEHSYDRN